MHAHRHSCNPQLLVKTGSGGLVTLSGFGVCGSAVLSAAPVRRMFAVVPCVARVSARRVRGLGKLQIRCKSEYTAVHKEVK